MYLELILHKHWTPEKLDLFSFFPPPPPSPVYQRACTGDFLQYWYLLSFFHCYLEGALFKRVNGVATKYQWRKWCVSIGQPRPAGCFCWIQIIDFLFLRKIFLHLLSQNPCFQSMSLHAVCEAKSLCYYRGVCDCSWFRQDFQKTNTPVFIRLQKYINKPTNW